MLTRAKERESNPCPPMPWDMVRCHVCPDLSPLPLTSYHQVLFIHSLAQQMWCVRYFSGSKYSSQPSEVPDLHSSAGQLSFCLMNHPGVLPKAHIALVGQGRGWETAFLVHSPLIHRCWEHAIPKHSLHHKEVLDKSTGSERWLHMGSSRVLENANAWISSPRVSSLISSVLCGIKT